MARTARIFSACVLSIGAASAARADVRDATWLGGAGTFTNAAMWSGGVVPNNTASDSFNVHIDGGNAQSSTATLTVGAGTISINRFTLDAGDTLALISGTLTTQSGATIHGTMNAGSGYLLFNNDALLDGSGEIMAPSGRTLRIGSVARPGTGTSLTIGPSLRVHAIDGEVGNALVVLANSGTITADATGSGSSLGGIFLRGSAIANTGTLAIGAGGQLSVAVNSYTMADLGTIVNNGGTLQLGGTLDNTARTLNIDGSLGMVRLAGTVRGGTINVAAGRSVLIRSAPATFDGVVLNGAFETQQLMRIAGDHVLRGTGLVVTLNDRNAANIGTDDGSRLTIAPGVTITGSGKVGNGAPLLNQGLLLASGQYVGIDSSAFTNQGTLEVRNGGTLRIGERSLQTFRSSDLGTMKSGAGGGHFQIGGILDNTGNTFVNGSPVSWELAGTMRGGVLQTLPNAPIVVPSFYSVDIENLTLDSAQIIVGEGYLQATGGFKGTGTVTVGGGFVHTRNALLEIDPGVTVRGSGTAGVYGILNRGTITADDGSIVVPLGARPAGLSVNLGTMSVRNTGILEASGTFTRADMGLLQNNGGSFAIGAGGTLENGGQVFDSSTDGPWILKGNLRGGRLVTTNSSKPLYVESVANKPSRLDDVIVDGTIFIEAYRALQLPANQTLHGSGTVVIRYYSSYGSVLSTASGPFTIDRGMTVRREFYDIYDPPKIGTPNAAFINHGSIICEAGSAALDLIGAGVFSDGTISIGDHSSIIVRGGLMIGDGGIFADTFDPTAAGLLDVQGSLDLSSLNDTLLLRTDAATFGSTYTIATYTGALSGTFDHVIGDAIVDYSTSGLIRVTVVPEPNLAAGALIVAVATSVRSRRRRVTFAA